MDPVALRARRVHLLEPERRPLGVTASISASPNALVPEEPVTQKGARRGWRARRSRPGQLCKTVQFDGCATVSLAGRIVATWRARGRPRSGSPLSSRWSRTVTSLRPQIDVRLSARGPCDLADRLRQRRLLRERSWSGSDVRFGATPGPAVPPRGRGRRCRSPLRSMAPLRSSSPSISRLRPSVRQWTPGTNRHRTRRRYASYSGKRCSSMDSSSRDFVSSTSARAAVGTSASGEERRDHPTAMRISPP